MTNHARHALPGRHAAAAGRIALGV
ncbi:MAG: hypothetical protein QOF00_4868, partial [Pseudonocardiales bacterium]|nr:hypothetical protein [Pseudonocardiales bacterium]